jgi:non-specific serine/threonine protein kinase
LEYGDRLLTLILTPHGRLLLEDRPDADPVVHEFAERLTHAFERGHGHGLVQLGAAEVQTPMPAVFAYWREFAL